MATHFVHQSTGLGNLTHGAVSQYEVYNDSPKPHTRFPPPGWDFSQTSSEDSLPLIQHVPQPEWKNTSFQPDPNLCITPERPQQRSQHFTRTAKHLESINPQKSAAVDKRSEVMNPPSYMHQKPDIDPDPLLALTPLKPSSDDAVSKVNGEIKKHRVRFDVEEDAEKWEENESLTVNNLDHKLPQKTSPEKVYQPELYGDDDDNFDFGNVDAFQQKHRICSLNQAADTRFSLKSDNMEDKQDDELNCDAKAKPSKTSKTVKYTVSKVNNQAVYVPLPDNIQNNDTTDTASKTSQNSGKSTQNKQNKQSSARTIGPNSVTVIREKPRNDSNSKTEVAEIKDPIASCVIPEQLGPKRKVKVLRESQYSTQESEYTYPFDQDPLAFAGGEEHMFARPEYNSTLRMKVEAEKYKKSEIDIEKALQKKLTMSESTKTSIHEKAAAQVNTDGQTFSGLVSLNVPVDELCKQVVEQKTSRAKQVKAAKKKTTDQKEPDLLDFFTEDRQKESVSFTTSGISAPSEKLSTVQHRRAFDLYKHNRVWERKGYRK